MLSGSAHISLVTDPKILDDIYKLRVRAWRTRLAISEDVVSWTDPLDLNATHWALHIDGALAGAARLSIHTDPEDLPDSELYASVVLDTSGKLAAMSRCVVDPCFRGLGLSAMLDRVRIQVARERGCASVVVTVPDEKRMKQLGLIGFQKLGEGICGPGKPVAGHRGIVAILYL